MFEGFESSSKEEWLDKALKDLKGKPLERLNWKTFEGSTIAPFYTQEDIKDRAESTLLPGQFPFLRSQKELSNGWLIREEIDQYKNFTATNRKALSAIENGSHNLVFSIKAENDGFTGIPVHQIDDLAKLLDNIDPTQTGISFKSGNQSPFYLKLLTDWVKQQGHDPSMLFGSIDYDPISIFLASGSTNNSWKEVFDHLAASISFTQGQLKHYKVLTIHSKTFQNTGASIVQELAFTLSMANEYLHQLSERNLSLDDIHQHLQIELGTGTTYFHEIAKVRALRWLWTTLTQQYTQNENAQKAYIVSKTSEWNKTLYDPHVNMLRSTTEAMAAAIGGADEIQIDAYDKSFRPTSSQSERVARNTHHLLSNEAHIDKSIDPAAGSYYLETLTHQLASEAWDLFKKTEEKGGILAIAKNGQLQEQLKASRKKREALLATGKEKFIGVNEYPNPLDKAMELVEQTMGKSLFKAHEGAASTSFETLNHISEYVQMQQGSKPEQCTPLASYMATEAFEQLRASVEVKQKEGKPLPRFFLLAIGSKAARAARANFALNLFQCGGFEVINPSGFDTVQEGVSAFSDSKCNVLVICSSDDEYESLIPAITKELRKAGKNPKLVLAGNPREKKEDFEDMGIENFIYTGCNIYETLISHVQ